MIGYGIKATPNLVQLGQVCQWYNCDNQGRGGEGNPVWGASQQGRVAAAIVQSITAPPQGASQMDPDCISICLVGDFDTSKPTPTQQRRLAQLVGTLQSKLRIPASEVQVYDLADSAAGIGHSFPVADFRNQILP